MYSEEEQNCLTNLINDYPNSSNTEIAKRAMRYCPELNARGENAVSQKVSKLRQLKKECQTTGLFDKIMDMWNEQIKIEKRLDDTEKLEGNQMLLTPHKKNAFVQIDTIDIRGDLVRMISPTFIKFDDVIRYQLNGKPSKDGDDIEEFTYEAWTSDGEHYYITEPNNVLEFMRKVSE